MNPKKEDDVIEDEKLSSDEEVDGFRVSTHHLSSGCLLRKPMEQPKHVYKERRLTSPVDHSVVAVAENLWSSMDYLVHSDGVLIPSGPLQEQEEIEVDLPLNITLASSPSTYGECGGSNKSSTPARVTPKSMSGGTPNSLSKGLTLMAFPIAHAAEKRNRSLSELHLDSAATAGPSRPKAKRSIIASSTIPKPGPVPFSDPVPTPSRPPPSQGLKDQKNVKILEKVNYGSEDEIFMSDEEDKISRPKRIIRGNAESFISSRFVAPAPLQSVPLASVSVLEPPVSALVPSTSAAPVPMHVKPALTECPLGADEFIWNVCPNPPIDPASRRFAFTGGTGGPVQKYSDPYDAFTTIWDRKIMELIAMETNRYAQRSISLMATKGTLCHSSRLTRWEDVTLDEVYLFFAIIIAMGVVVKSRVEEYWNVEDIFSTPSFKKVMSYNRFILLSRCLHFRDDVNLHEQTMKRSEAKLFKLAPILDHLNDKFQTLYNLPQNISLDESLTLWKGWLEINQFIPKKAAGVGIKTYEVCDSRTGYLWRFLVYTGHDNDKTSSSHENTTVSGATPSLVLRLLNGLEYKGHTVWMDNYFNSPALARELKSRGFDSVGTIRLQRQFVPVELTMLTKRDLKTGELCGATSGDIDIIVWKDKNLVNLISTYHGLQIVKCRNKLKPSVVCDYNVCMGGVDRKAQMLAMYPVERKRTRVWYKKFFRRLLNTSVLNAFILLRASQPNLKHRGFRRVLATQIIARHSPPAPQQPVLTAFHEPAQHPMVFDKRQPGRVRRACALCKTRTSTYCTGCNIALCVFTCFGPYHRR